METIFPWGTDIQTAQSIFEFFMMINLLMFAVIIIGPGIFRTKRFSTFYLVPIYVITPLLHILVITYLKWYISIPIATAIAILMVIRIKTDIKKFSYEEKLGGIYGSDQDREIQKQDFEKLTPEEKKKIIDWIDLHPIRFYQKAYLVFLLIEPWVIVLLFKSLFSTYQF